MKIALANILIFVLFVLLISPSFAHHAHDVKAEKCITDSSGKQHCK